MASLSQWVGGARPRTLPTAVASVAVGTGLAVNSSSLMPVRALLALLVAIALQVGVNYANDYSDGIKGTDEARVGPVQDGWHDCERNVPASAEAVRSCFVV